MHTISADFTIGAEVEDIVLRIRGYVLGRQIS